MVSIQEAKERIDAIDWFAILYKEYPCNYKLVANVNSIIRKNIELSLKESDKKPTLSDKIIRFTYDGEKQEFVKLVYLKEAVEEFVDWCEVNLTGNNHPSPLNKRAKEIFGDRIVD